MTNPISFPLPRKLSILVPVLNEEDAVGLFVSTLQPLLASLVTDYEMIFISDGSTDQTVSRLEALQKTHPQIQILELSRNFGKEAALAAGLDACTGDACIPMDVDLQDNPSALQEMLAKWAEGFDIVYGMRTRRDSDSVLKRVTSKAFYRLMGSLSRTPIHHNVCDYNLLDRRVIDTLKTFPEQNRFLRGLSSWVGFNQTIVKFERPARSIGKTKHNWIGLFRLALDGITSFSTAPLKISFYLGLLFATLSFAYLFFIVIRTLLFGSDVPGYASLMVVVLFIGGIQMISLGIIGEYLGRIFEETKHRPVYILKKKLTSAQKAD